MRFWEIAKIILNLSLEALIHLSTVTRVDNSTFVD